MQRFVNILFCPLARRENAPAFRRVQRLSFDNGGALTVLGVVPEPPRLQRLFMSAGGEASLQSRLVDDLGQHLAQRYRGSDEGRVELAVEVGNTAIAIIERVLDFRHDLVVVTTDDSPGDEPTIRRLLRKCPCPVWVMRPTRARTQRVLAAVNSDPEEAALNRLILELASSMLALGGGGELHVVHAWELYGESALRSSPFLHVPAEELREALADAEAAHRLALDRVLASHAGAGVHPQIHLVKGAPGEVIPALVSQLRINLMVMGTVARTGIPGLLIGNTAEQILDDVRCSVIAVKPPGFVSPIGRREP